MSVALLRQRTLGKSTLLFCSFFLSLCLFLFPSHPCLSAIHNSGPLALTFFHKLPQQIFFKKNYLLKKNVYPLYFAISHILHVSSPTLAPLSPQTHVLCNAAKEQPVLELEYQLH